VARSLREEGEGEDGEDGEDGEKGEDEEEDEEKEEEGKECECKECECKESEKGEECECKECECSEEGEKCEEEEGKGGGTHKANVMAATVIGLILLTIFFETLREGMEERAGEDLAEIVDAMFGELTVLGFIGLVTFISIQTKAANWLGMYAFPADEEHGHEFVEVLEELHMLLFFVMVCRALLPPDTPQHCSMPPTAIPADAPQRPEHGRLSSSWRCCSSSRAAAPTSPTVRAHPPGRLSALSTSHSKSVLNGAFCGRAGSLTVKNGGLRPGRDPL
jgi:hypothetical protein